MAIVKLTDGLRLILLHVLLLFTITVPLVITTSVFASGTLPQIQLPGSLQTLEIAPVQLFTNLRNVLVLLPVGVIQRYL